MPEKIRMAAIGDSPKLHTGFAVVMEQLCQGFYDAGIELHVFGLLDRDEDFECKLPYAFYPMTGFDELGHGRFSLFLRKIKPNVIFILTDPGNLAMYMNGIVVKKCCDIRIGGQDYIPPVVAYTPIEGSPMYESHGEGFQMVQDVGQLVVYCQSAKELLQKQFPSIEPEIVYHGLDHADFRPYSEEERQALRRMAGLDDFFVVGSIGVNKRTKGFPTLIYAAQIMRQKGWDEGVKFYLHTDADRDTMFGYKLKELANFYGVRDMFLFRQDNYDNYYLGTERNMNTVEQVMEIEDRIPDQAAGRGLMFMSYDFISRVNCLDLYVDPSEVEGWGLPVGEAMMCGVPVLSVHDHHVRDEIYAEGAWMIEPAEPRLWTTWHPGARLVLIDPLKIAEGIHELHMNIEKREELSQRGLELARRYKWTDAKEKMTKIVLDVVEKERQALGH